MDNDTEISNETETESDSQVEEFEKTVENFLVQTDLFLEKLREEIQKSDAVIKAKMCDL